MFVCSSFNLTKPAAGTSGSASFAESTQKTRRLGEKTVISHDIFNNSERTPTGGLAESTCGPIACQNQSTNHGDKSKLPKAKNLYPGFLPSF